MIVSGLTAGGAMKAVYLKQVRRARRKKRVRKKVFGTPERPRLSVCRSLKNIYAQLIDDAAGRTLCQASTLEKQMRETLGHGGNRSSAAAVGKLLGERAREAGIARVTVDRNGYRFHGRVKALAEAAREAGLEL